MARVIDIGVPGKQSMEQPRAEQELEQPAVEVLDRLAEYCQYLYEEEKSRTERIERKMHVFAVALGATVVVMLGCLPLSKLSDASVAAGAPRVIVAVPLAICIALLALCTVYIFRVYKVQRFERLTDPKIATVRAMSMRTKSELLSSIIADYAVATNRNHEINERKAEDLSRALILLLGALISFITSLVCLNVLVLWGKAGG
jgi:hypothetical protein